VYRALPVELAEVRFVAKQTHRELVTANAVELALNFPDYASAIFDSFNSPHSWQIQ